MDLLTLSFVAEAIEEIEDSDLAQDILDHLTRHNVGSVARMAVTRDIVEAHWRPRRVMARLLAMGLREDRALAMLMGSCLLLFMSQWPYRARQAHETGGTLTDTIQHDAVGLIFVLPLLAYGLAALLRLVTRAFIGAKRISIPRDWRFFGHFWPAPLRSFWPGWPKGSSGLVRPIPPWARYGW